MGHDIKPLGNHDLDTSNIHNLARDLVHRLEVNVSYGYHGIPGQLKLLGRHPTYDFIELGNYTSKSNRDTIQVFDEKYLAKQLVEKFGGDIFGNLGYWDDLFDHSVPDDMILGEKENLKVINYDIQQNVNGEFNFMSIYNGHYSNSMVYYSRWWGLCRFFMDGDFEAQEQLENFTDFREKLSWYMHKMGGNKIYYVDDQSEMLKGVGQGDEAEYSWPELERYIKEKTGYHMVDVPKFFMERDYRQSILQWEEFPLSFVDDFRDLK